jgi:hypothetical protein
VRDAAPVSAAAEKDTVPLPEPEAPDCTVIQAALLTAVHVQVEADAFTLTVPLPPLLPNACDTGLSE